MAWILALFLGLVEAPYYLVKDTALRATCHRGVWSEPPYRWCCQPEPGQERCHEEGHDG